MSAKGAGLSPIWTTASPSNHEELLQLGATKCFDYRDAGVVENIKHALESSGQPLRHCFDTICSTGEDSSTKMWESLQAGSRGPVRQYFTKLRHSELENGFGVKSV
jgi:NADPH:quinone reductase-like Zn-dependent oxidoreductase